jgi:hypothetical protein
MGITVQKIADYPSYFFTFYHRKGFWVANLLYEVIVSEEEL